MALPTYAVPVAIGAAGVALAVLGYLFLKGKKPPVAQIAPPKKVPAKPSGGGGYAGGGAAKPTDWKLTGYRAGLAQGKADKAARRPFGTSFKKAESPPSSVPGGTDPKTTLTFRQLWTLGWIDGYPVGYGGDASGKVAAAPKYAVDAYSVEEWDAVEAEESPTGGAGAAAEAVEGAVEEAGGAVEGWFGGSETETSGVPIDLYHHSARSAGAWGPRRHVLAHAKTGAILFPRRAGAAQGVREAARGPAYAVGPKHDLGPSATSSSFFDVRR